MTPTSPSAGVAGVLEVLRRDQQHAAAYRLAHGYADGSLADAERESDEAIRTVEALYVATKAFQRKLWKVAEHHNDRSCDYDVCKEARDLQAALAAYRGEAALGGAAPKDCGEAGHDEGRCGNASCRPTPAAPKGGEATELSDWNEFRERRIALFKMWSGFPLEEVEKARDAYVASEQPTTPAGGGDAGIVQALIDKLYEVATEHNDRTCDRDVCKEVRDADDLIRRLASTGSALNLETIREAADVLEAVSDSGVELPDNWRWPLIDELRGIVGIAGGAPAPSAYQLGARIVWTSRLGVRYFGTVRYVNPASEETYYLDLDHGTEVECARVRDLALAPTQEPQP